MTTTTNRTSRINNHVRFAISSVSSLALAAAVALTAMGCAAEQGSAEELEDEEAGDFSVDTTHDDLTTGCSLSRAQILDSVSGARERAVRRGFTWYDRKVPYSQSRWFEGYRTDCSGFVSMSWELGRSYTTASFVRGAGQNEMLESYNDLKPGDALVRRSNGAGHIVMFLGWNNAARTSACVIEQASTKLDMEFGSRSVASMRKAGYKATRGDKY